MKLFIRRSVSGSTRTNPTDPTFCFSPGTIGKVIGHHPLGGPLTPPIQANYASLGPTGGINTNSPQPGIKFLKNGVWLPFTVNYFRISQGSSITRRNFGPGGFALGASGSYRDADFGLLAGVGAGRAALSGFFSPVSGPITQMSQPGRIISFPDKLNLSGSSSNDVYYSDNSETGQGIWSTVAMTNGFPAASGYLQGIDAIESSWINQQLWLINSFVNSPAAVSCDNLNANMVFDNAICEYYEIAIDDSLVANLAASQNVYIVVPVTWARDYVQKQAGLSGLGDVVTDDNRANNRLTALSTQEFVIPLTYLLSQSAANLPTENSTNETLVGQVFPSTSGNYDINIVAAIKVSTNAMPEIFFIDPVAPPANVGPY